VKISLEGLDTWTKQSDPAVKFFSGTATYQSTFIVPLQMLDSERSFILNLGQVKVIAELEVNGIGCGTLWKPPFEADVTSAIKAGTNSLQVKVTNLWPNRLIGDERLPEDCDWQRSQETDQGYPIAQWPEWLLQGRPSPTGRTTFTTWKHWHKDSTLLDSGLLGPVILHVLERRTLR
jgi:hypothetical protein